MNGLTVMGLCVLIVAVAAGLLLTKKTARTTRMPKLAIIRMFLVRPGDYRNESSDKGDRAAWEAAETIEKRLRGTRAAVPLVGPDAHPALSRTARIIADYMGGPLDSSATVLRKLADPVMTAIDETTYCEVILPMRSELGLPSTDLNVVLVANGDSIAKAKRDFTGPGGYIDVSEPAFGSVHELVIEYDPKTGQIYRRYFVEGN